MLHREKSGNPGRNRRWKRKFWLHWDCTDG
jgi:hypothetical protein